jgi:putative FmdB family regulatory protein
MPIYEYICNDCGHQIERIQKVDDPPPAQCEKCGGPIHRPISRTSFQLKGSGWYADGYASTAPKGESKGESKGENTGKETSGGESNSGDRTKSESSTTKREPKSSGSTGTTSSGKTTPKE